MDAQHFAEVRTNHYFLCVFIPRRAFFVNTMNITLSADLATLTLSPPLIRNTEKVATSMAADADGNPFIIRIETTLGENLHDAKNRSYVDMALVDDAALNTFQQLDAHILDKVYENHDSKLWFGKRAPRDIIAGYCKSIVMGNSKSPHPFIRCKAGYVDGKPNVVVKMASQENPGDATCSSVSTFDEMKGARVVYEVQLTGIRFCPTTFNPELKLLHVHTFMSPGDYNLFDQLLNNANHCENKARIVERQQRMEQFEVERRQLEELQAEVEAEVSAAIAKRDDIEVKYKAVLEAMEAARVECEMGVGQDSIQIITTDGDNEAVQTSDCMNTTTEGISCLQETELVQENDGVVEGTLETNTEPKVTFAGIEKNKNMTSPTDEELMCE